MGNALNVNLLEKRENTLNVDLCRSEKGLSDALTAKLFARNVERIGILVYLKHLTAKGKSVRVNTCRRESYNHVALSHTGIIKYLFLVNDTDRKACKVVILNGHHTGMLRSFSAYKRRARLNTPLGNTADDSCDLLGNILSASDVIKEEERLRATANNVVYAHCNRIDTDSVVLVHKDSHLNFSTATVSARNENRLFHSRNRKTEAAAKAAYVVKTTLVFCSCDVLFHKLDRFISGGNINARRRVAFTLGIVMHFLFPH